MGLLFKFGQAVPEICILVLQKRRLFWTRVTGELILEVVPKTIFDGFL